MLENQPILTTELTYSPGAILNLFNNAISVSQAKRMIQMKGIYVPGKGHNYSGYYYDTLRDESSDAQLTLIVPGLVRNELTANKTIEFYGYVTRKVVNNGGRIEIQATISELLSQMQNKYSEKDIRTLEIQQKKAATGYRDVDSFVKAKIIHNEPVTVNIIIGRNAIIDSDIKHQLEETISCYQFNYERVNLTSETEIISALERHNNTNTDILIISRGGGDNLEIFNSTDLAEYCLDLVPYFITAIGHKENVTLLQKIADKAFITPTALGQYLNDIYNDTVAELQSSKAELVEAITKQLEGQYQKQVQNLGEKIKTLEELSTQKFADTKTIHAQEVENLKNQIKTLNLQQYEKESLLYKTKEIANSYKAQVDRLQTEVTKPAGGKPLIWILVVVALIIGILLGRGCNM